MVRLHRLVAALLRTTPATPMAAGPDRAATVRGLLRAAVPAEPWIAPATWPV